MKGKELRTAGLMIVGGSSIGLTIRLFMSGELILGAVVLAITVALIVFSRRRAQEEQGEEALEAAEEYNRFHGDGDGDEPVRKEVP